MFRFTRLVVILLLLSSAAAAGEEPPDGPPQERLGARVSFTGTTGDLNQYFGHGYDFTLYFTERLFRTLYLDIRIGATYFGDLLIPEIGEEFTNITGIASEMRFAYLTLGPQYAADLTDTQTIYFSLGLGIFSVSMLFDTGIQAFDLSDQHFGMNAGAGLYWRITDNWNIDVNATFQSVWAEEDRLYAIFAGGGRNPVTLLLGLGVAMNLR